MLHHLFPLRRDPSVHRTSFGTTDMVGYTLGESYRQLVGRCWATTDQHSWHYNGVLNVGLSATFDGCPRQLPLHKSIEWWPDTLGAANARHQTVSVVLERLFYETDRGLVPYGWRYLSSTMPVWSLVHRENLENLHAHLHGLTGMLSVRDPRQVYLDKVVEHHSSCPEERLDDLQKRVSMINQGERFSRHAFGSDEIALTLTQMTEGLSWSFDPDHLKQRPSYLYDTLVGPKLQVADPISVAYPTGPIGVTQLMRFHTRPPFDVSDPIVLMLRHPEITEMQSKSCRLLAATLDPILATDYALTLRVVNGAVVGETWEYLVCRTMGLLNLNIERVQDVMVQRLRAAARQAFHCALYTTQERGVEKFLDEADVQIIKTFGDEALVTVSRHAHPIAAYYIDFAEITFCSMGLTSESSVFRAETGVNHL